MAYSPQISKYMYPDGSLLAEAPFPLYSLSQRAKENGASASKEYWRYADKRNSLFLWLTVGLTNVLASTTEKDETSIKTSFAFFRCAWVARGKQDNPGKNTFLYTHTWNETRIQGEEKRARKPDCIFGLFVITFLIHRILKSYAFLTLTKRGSLR